MTYVYSNAG